MKKTGETITCLDLFQKVFLHHHDGMMVQDASGKIVLCNLMSEKMFEKSKTQIIGKKIETLIPKAERAFFTRHANQKETRYVQIDKGVLTIDLQVFRVDGVLTNVLTFHLLSYKNEIDRNLLLAKTVHKTLIEMVEDDIYVLDARACVIYVNQHGAKTLHLERQDIIGKKLAGFFPKDANHIRESIHTVLKTGRVFSRESRITFPDGSVRWFRTQFNPIKEGGKVVAILGVSHDVSKYKIAEDTIRQLEEKYELLVEKSSDGILVIQKEEIQFLNSTMAKLLSVSASKCIGKKFIDFVAPEYQEHVMKQMHEALGKNICDMQCKFEIEVQSKPVRFIEAHGSLIPFEGKPAIMLIVRDKTQERELEKMKMDFMSIASHQMRTPLTGIKWFAELLQTEKTTPLTKTQSEYMTEIVSSNERMIHLINDLLNVAQIEQGNGYYLKVKIENPKTVLKEVLKEQQTFAQKKNQKIQWRDESSANIVLRIDASKMYEVFQNILSNAIKYSPEGTEIVVQSSLVNNEYIISITDHGVGIPEKQQNRVFQRFFRADNVMTTEGGTGLGLYVAKSIVDKHKGRMWFESKEGKGSTFHIALPITKNKK